MEMKRETLNQRVTSLQARITPDFVQAEVGALLREGEDVGGGVNAVRLIRRWVGHNARYADV